MLELSPPQAERSPDGGGQRVSRAWGDTGGGPGRAADAISVARRKGQGGQTVREENCSETLNLLSLISVTAGPEWERSDRFESLLRRGICRTCSSVRPGG